MQVFNAPSLEEGDLFVDSSLPNCRRNRASGLRISQIKCGAICLVNHVDLLETNTACISVTICLSRQSPIAVWSRWVWTEMWNEILPQPYHRIMTLSSNPSSDGRHLVRK
jgi:hypothetical protein